MLKKDDLIIIATFALGMGAFWLIGIVGTYLPYLKNHSLAIAVSLTVTALIYGLIFAGWTALVIRRRQAVKGIIVGSVLTIALGVVAAQAILRLATGHVHTKLDLAWLTFALYVCYGSIYVVGLAVVRRRSR